MSYNQVHDLNFRSHGFHEHRLKVLIVPGDGSCLFHAIARAYYIPYINERDLQGNYVRRQDIVKRIRSQLADALSEKTDPLKHDSPIKYEMLGGGSMMEFSKSVPELSLVNMQNTLRSDQAIGHGYFEFLSNELQKDIYILDANQGDVYITGDEEYTIKGRPSVIVLYNGSHYDLVGELCSDGSIATHFLPTHRLIQFLRNRIKERTNSKW